jgi:hypothetical protein
MKKAGLLLLCGVFAVALVASVEARPNYKKEHDKQIENKVVKDAKCNVCHYGKSKKNRNDYGKALTKAGLTKDKYTELKTDKDALAKHISDTLKKFLEEDEAGKKWAAKLKEGELPKNPE